MGRRFGCEGGGDATVSDALGGEGSEQRLAYARRRLKSLFGVAVCVCPNPELRRGRRTLVRGERELLESDFAVRGHGELRLVVYSLVRDVYDSLD